MQYYALYILTNNYALTHSSLVTSYVLVLFMTPAAIQW